MKQHTQVNNSIYSCQRHEQNNKRLAKQQCVYKLNAPYRSTAASVTIRHDIANVTAVLCVEVDYNPLAEQLRPINSLQMNVVPFVNCKRKHVINQVR